MRYQISFAVLLLSCAMAVTCQQSQPSHVGTRGLPPGVHVTPLPGSETPIADPQFTAFPGASAHFGYANGGAYRIEIPDSWNGRLVMYMRGSNVDQQLRVQIPPIRYFLVRNGYAWASSSYDQNGTVTGAAADQTAALWDLFVRQFRVPTYTYVVGGSMGGSGALISAERYANRYDGALSFCGIDDPPTSYASDGDLFVAALFAAGVTQKQFDSSSLDDLIAKRILPAMNDSAARSRFEAIAVDLSGGPRPFAVQGLRTWEPFGLGRAADDIRAGLYDNERKLYLLDASAGVTSGEFNREVVRINGGPRLASIPASDDVTGDIKIPVLSITTTGDANVPLSQQQLLRRRVDEHGKGAFLVQRTVQDPDHCGMLNSELDAAFVALVNWVEQGVRPKGEDLLAHDLTNLGEAFTAVPRVGSPAAAAMPFARERITVTGRATLDGAPLMSVSLGVAVVDHGLIRNCEYARTSSTLDGQFLRVVAPDAEMPGCGRPGAQLYLDTQLQDGSFILSQNAVPWPTATHEVTFDASFSSQKSPRLTFVAGDVLSAAGRRVAPGAVVEAFKGSTLCGRTSIPGIGRGADGYFMIISGTDLIPGCNNGLPLTFHVNGKRASIAAELGREIDLVAPE